MAKREGDGTTYFNVCLFLENTCTRTNKARGGDAYQTLADIKGTSSYSELFCFTEEKLANILILYKN